MKIKDLSLKNINSTLFGPRIQSREITTLLGLVHLPPNPRVLEVGCGKGSALMELARRGNFPAGEFMGLDKDTQALDEARRKAQALGLEIGFYEEDITHLPFPDGYFDLVYGMAVLHHVEKWQRVPAEVHRVLKGGASYYVVENTRPFFRLPLAKVLDHACSIFSEGELMEVIRRVGFYVRLCERRGFYKHVLHGSVRLLAVKP